MPTLEETLKGIDQRLSAVEFQLRLLQLAESGAEAPAKVVPATVTPKPVPEYHPWEMSERSPDAKPAATPVDSSTMLAVIGIAFVILAAVFFIKMSVDSGWLTPVRQVLLAAATGMAFFLAPQILSEKAKAYGAFLAAAGTTILHLTWLGAYSYHHILPAKAALVCATVVGLGSVLANFAAGKRMYLLIALAGTYLAAPIVGYETADLPILSIFLVIWNISFSVTAMVHKSRDILFITSYYAVFTLLLLTKRVHGIDQQTALLGLQIVQLFIFSAAMLAYSIYHKSPLSTEESIAILPVLLLFYASSIQLVSLIVPNLVPWFGLMVGAFVLAIYFIARKYLGSTFKSGNSLTAFVAIASVHSLYFELLSESLQPLAALVIGVALVSTSLLWPSVRRQFYWPMIVLAATVIYGAIQTFVAVNVIDHISFYNLAYGAVALGIFAKVVTSQKLNDRSVGYLSVLLGFAHLEVLLGLYRFSQDISWSGALFVSIAWGFYAVLILAAGYWRRDKTLGQSALTILLAVSLKAFFYDLIDTTSLIRVGCLLGEGLLLYGCGWIFKKMQTWSHTD